MAFKKIHLLMVSVAQIDRAIRSVLASQRVGQPVFVRCLIQGSATGYEVEKTLARVTGLMSAWLNQQLQRIYALGASQGEGANLALQFRDGATALVSYLHEPGRGDDLNLMILGNHGAIYHEGCSALMGDEVNPFFSGQEHPAVEVTPILDAVQRSLRSGQPESIFAEPRP